MMSTMSETAAGGFAPTRQMPGAVSAAQPLHGAQDTYHEAFQAVSRLLFLCTSGHHHGSDSNAELGECRVDVQAPKCVLTELTEGPYFLIAMYLNAEGLIRVDATCRQFRELNRAHGGPWHELGVHAFLGLELDGDGVFDSDGTGNELLMGCRKFARTDWKGRYSRFRERVPTFRAPFTGAQITAVKQMDEIAYCRCSVRTDILNTCCNSGMYLEFEVLTNPDNVSLAVVDFEAGGCSSVTFSPDTGAVIRERKVCETPRKVEGAYIQPLNTTTPGLGFEGSMGLYLRGGHLAFFRKHANSSKDGKDVEAGPWESTGFVTDLTWAEGRRLTPCLAFRDEGTYHVRMICVSSRPPIMPERNGIAYEETSWSGLDWDAGQEEALES